jgi:hypothetical protein
MSTQKPDVKPAGFCVEAAMMPTYPDEEVQIVRKRITALLLVLALIAALAACGRNAIQPEQNTDIVTTPIPTAPAGWGSSEQGGVPDPNPTVVYEFKEKIYPDPPNEGIYYSFTRVEGFLEKINPALRAAGRDEMLIDEARVDENIDDDPPLDYFFIYFSRSGLEIDFAVNRETQNIESAFIALYEENEFAKYEADFYFNLFLIMFEPNEHLRILDELDSLNGAMQTVDGENWSILHQPTLINFFPIVP